MASLKTEEELETKILGEASAADEAEERKAEAAAPSKKKKAFVPPPGGFPKNKKLTKAERRELQDKQRAANAAAKAAVW